MVCKFLGAVNSYGDHPDVWNCHGGYGVCTLKDFGMKTNSGEPIQVCDGCRGRKEMDCPKLSIVMPMYRRRDSVEMTIQAIKIYHPEVMNDVEIIVCDNEGIESANGKAIRQLMESFKGRWQCKYVAFRNYQGTAVGKQKAIDEATGNAILCIDSHVMLPPGVLKRLIGWYEANPNTNDLYQGPCWQSDLQNNAGVPQFAGTHLKPEWSGGMYGVWGNNPDVLLGEPYEIDAMGMGLFSCRREAWPGFDPDSRGFGVEEFVTHAKFKARGNKTVLLPWLLWWHLFDHVEEQPKPSKYTDRLMTYIRSNVKTGVPSLPGMKTHFVDELKVIAGNKFDEMVLNIRASIDKPKTTIPASQEQLVAVAKSVAASKPTMQDRIAQHEEVFPCKFRHEYLRLESRQGGCAVEDAPCFSCSLASNRTGEATLWRYCRTQIQPICNGCEDRIAPSPQ